ELCASLVDGGTTPAADLIAAAKGQAGIPVFVLVRPRAGSFVYSDAEFDAMLRDIERARTVGADGIVTGALRYDHTVDTAKTAALIKAAKDLPVTFHRALDSTPDLAEALEQVIACGASRVLTSGGASNAMEGAATIAALIKQAGARITIVAGGGVRDHNVRELLDRTNASEVHSRMLDEATMRKLVSLAAKAGPAGA
ncbi:MAG: copper homeostasis protein CutC, partial [Gemmatimonadales bacterium]